VQLRRVNHSGENVASAELLGVGFAAVDQAGVVERIVVDKRLESWLRLLMLALASRDRFGSVGACHEGNRIHSMVRID